MYGATKAALERFTQGLAQEVAGHGIAVCALSPSQVVPTPGTVYHKLVTGFSDPRGEPPMLMARAALLLASEPAAKVNGRVQWRRKLCCTASSRCRTDVGNANHVPLPHPSCDVRRLALRNGPGGRLCFVLSQVRRVRPRVRTLVPTMTTLSCWPTLSARIPAYFRILRAHREPDQIGNRGATAAAFLQRRQAVGRSETLFFARRHDCRPQVRAHDQPRAPRGLRERCAAPARLGRNTRRRRTDASRAPGTGEARGDEGTRPPPMSRGASRAL